MVPDGAQPDEVFHAYRALGLKAVGPRCYVLHRPVGACWQDSKVKTRRTLLPIATAFFITTLSADAPNVEEATSKLSPQVLREIAQVEAEIDRIEAQAIDRLAAPPDNQIQQIELLEKVMLYDTNLSVYRNEACAFCHMPETGFTGPVSELNRTTGALSRLGAHAIQRPQAAVARLCTAVAGVAL
jgi:cytochrome c peroxidase